MPAQIHYFHQVDDPYSQLMAQALPALLENEGVRLTIHAVPPPDDAAAPDRERLLAWSRRDAQRLADALGLRFVDHGRQPEAAQITQAQRTAVAACGRDQPARQTLAEGGGSVSRCRMHLSVPALSGC